MATPQSQTPNGDSPTMRTRVFEYPNARVTVHSEPWTQEQWEAVQRWTAFQVTHNYEMWFGDKEQAEPVQEEESQKAS